MVHYKFTYFYFRGLGETIRYIFHYAGVDFDDDRIQMEDWMKHKSMLIEDESEIPCKMPEIINKFLIFLLELKEHLANI
uniref:glutathione transferase n=1 Tax=Romanomermis culicivorax TaxID=13658 RepID=A0A915IS86_ROMCU